LAKNRGRKPLGTNDKLPQATVAINFDSEAPKFCLTHLQNGFDATSLKDNRSKASFAEALQKRSRMTWSEIKQADRHGLGTEFIPKNKIRGPIPPGFADADRFMMLRYDGKLPMGGIRIGDILHILWIEPEFNKLYAHGS
jgi:hypothetical protein